jgi:threonylcarbamoyladenosine tRNA methylthiotransferase MtaB
MNRAYAPSLYAAIVERIHREMPEAAIGCDVLVGFPGETDPQFRNTERFLAALPLAYLHVFSYSPRPGTPSLRLGAEVPAPLRKERSSRLRALDRELRARFAASQLGTVQAVLPEGPVMEGDWQGITGNYLRVRFAWRQPEGALRSMPLVLLERAEGARVRGRLLSPQLAGDRGAAGR